jgi:hypothetical protein
LGSSMLIWWAFACVDARVDSEVQGHPPNFPLASGL